MSTLNPSEIMRLMAEPPPEVGHAAIVKATGERGKMIEWLDPTDEGLMRGKVEFPDGSQRVFNMIDLDQAHPLESLAEESP